MNCYLFSVSLNYLPPDFFLPNPLLCVFFAKYEPVAFKRIAFGKRASGKNSIQAKRMAGLGLKGSEGILAIQEGDTMSKSLWVMILQPIDAYDSATVYDGNDGLRQIYSGSPQVDGYFKSLKICSVYASSRDIQQFMIKEYGLSADQFRHYSVCSYGNGWIYRFDNGESIVLTREQEDSLKREHINEGIYCRPYRSFSADVYGSVMDDLFPEAFMRIDDALVSRAIALIGEQYGADLIGEREEDASEEAESNAVECILDYESSMDGKLLVGLILGQYIAKRIGGIAVAEYD